MYLANAIPYDDKDKYWSNVISLLQKVWTAPRSTPSVYFDFAGNSSVSGIPILFNIIRGSLVRIFPSFRLQDIL
jgi:hypothetical protein